MKWVNFRASMDGCRKDTVFCRIVGTVQGAVATCRPVKRSLSERQVATAPCTVPAYAAGAQSPVDKPLGERLYLTHCAFCHGQIGEGGRGPTLARPKLIHAPDDEALKVVIRGGIPSGGMPGTRLVDAELRELAEHVRKLGRVQPAVLAGDPKHGAEIYRTKGDCAACHTLSGNGGAFGPDLTGVGASRSPQHLRESLLDPAADFPRGFAFIRAVSRDGRTLTGVRVNEDTFSIQFRAAAGKLHSLWKAELREYQKDLAKSPMPSYREKLTPGELDDLVAYLASLQEAK